MARQLKRWESPRKEGRNDKGRGGSARQRQRKKQFQALRKKLKEQSDGQDDKNQKNKNGEADISFPFLLASISIIESAIAKFPFQPLRDLRGNKIPVPQVSTPFDRLRARRSTFSNRGLSEVETRPVGTLLTRRSLRAKT